MTVVTLTPDGTVSSSGVGVTGAANAHSALNDNSDSSYITNTSTVMTLELGLSDLALPAGAVITSLAAALRDRKVLAGGTLLNADIHSFPYGGEDVLITWTAFADYVTARFTASSYGAIADADVDAATLYLRKSTSSAIEIAKASVEVTYVAKPVTDVTAPSGSVSNTNTPAVTWTNTLDSDGGAQAKYEVKIFSAAQYGAGGFSPDSSTPTETSGIVADAGTSWSPSDPLPDATYRAYVRVAQAVLGSDHWSDWNYEGFTITANAPGVPTLTVTPEDDEARIWIELHATAGATTHAFEVQRSTDAGATWATIRTLDGGLITPTSGVGRAYDTEVGNGVSVIYRARALNIITEFTTYSTWSSSSTPTSWESTSWWLKSPTQPDLNIPIELAGMDPLDQNANQGIFQPLGRRLPIVVSDIRSGFHGAVSFTFDNQLERDEFYDLLDTLEPLLLQAPPSNYWEDRYIMLGGLSRSRGFDKAFVEWTAEKVTWTEVDAPTGDVIEWPAFAS